MKYTTVEGHEIKLGECYELRDGKRAFITRLDSEGEYRQPICVAKTGYDSTHRCRMNGDHDNMTNTHDWDIMRPWPKEESTGLEEDKYAITFKTGHKSFNRYGWDGKEDKKHYKLSQMWRVWWKDSDGKICRDEELYLSKKEARENNVKDPSVLAITRADATEFYEGEGLDD